MLDPKQDQDPKPTKKYDRIRIRKHSRSTTLLASPQFPGIPYGTALASKNQKLLL